MPAGEHVKVDESCLIYEGVSEPMGGGRTIEEKSYAD